MEKRENATNKQKSELHCENLQTREKMQNE